MNNELVGIIITPQEVGNMRIDHISVPAGAVKTILESIRLNEDVQQEVVDKMVEHTPNYFGLSPEEQAAKIIHRLTLETVIEYLRLNEDIKEGITMLETGFDEEGTAKITAYYVAEDETTSKLGLDKMTAEQVEELERQTNLIDASVDIFAEAQKKLEKMKADNVIPFPNREQRRAMKRGK